MTAPLEKTDLQPVDPRVLMAAERTLLAWVRTGLAAMGFGFVVARFGVFLRELAAVRDAAPQSSSGNSLWIGTGLVLMGVIMIAVASVQHRRTVRALHHQVQSPIPSSFFALLVSVVLALLGLAMAIYLLTLS